MRPPAGFLPVPEAHRRVADALLEARRILLTGHVGMDGDSLGSAMALWHGLRSAGRELLVAAGEPVPKVFSFLARKEAVHVMQGPGDAWELARWADLLVILDNNSWERLGWLEAPARAGAVRCAVVDHHPCPQPLCELHLLDRAAAATGLIVHDLLEHLGVSPTPAIAEALYTTVVNDTGWFRHSNTDARTLRVCRRLLEAGARPERIDRNVNHRESLPRKRLEARFLETLSLELEGRAAVGEVRRSMLEETGTTSEDSEAFIEHVRSLEGIRLALLLREEPGGRIKVSLRSCDGCSALRIAEGLGGGGHERAAGASVPGRLPDVRRRVLEAARLELEGPGSCPPPDPQRPR